MDDPLQVKKLCIYAIKVFLDTRVLIRKVDKDLKAEVDEMKKEGGEKEVGIVSLIITLHITLYDVESTYQHLDSRLPGSNLKIERKG